MRKIRGALIIFSLFFALSVVAVRAETLTAPMAMEGDELPLELMKSFRQQALENWMINMLSDETVQNEMKNRNVSFGNVTMRYTVETIGEKPESGYPLYIALHGGGADDTPDLNDSQWLDMQSYYRRLLDCGVYVAVRGVRDTWDTHFNPESYPLYDRLIEYMILTENVDPNRVYLTGFSAGGDGVYAVGARMADRFAAANMSSGHPNGISMINFCNLPIQLQAGEEDTMYDRHIITAEYGLILDELQTEFPDSYIHRTLIHADRGHNYEDYSKEDVSVFSNLTGYLSGEDRSTEPVDSYAPDWLETFVRAPLPEMVRWDLSTRADLRQTDSFYYLSADKDARGIIQVYHRENDVIITTENFEGDFMIMFNEDMIDFEDTVHFTIAGMGEVDVLLIPEKSWIEKTTADRGDPNYQFEAAVSYSWLLENI